MRAKHIAVALTGLFVGLAAVQPSEARVVRLVVEQRTSFVGGADWGKAGPYEMLRGTAHLEADPNNPHDAVIVDLENASRNGKGLVEFSTQFMILKPVDMQRSNRKIFYAVNNRGNNLEGLLTATTAGQVSGTDAGYAMTEGYVVVDAGWEGDVIPASSKLVASLPRARNANGTPITGLMRYEYSDRATGSFTTNLEGNAAFLSYEAADTNTANATFTVPVAAIDDLSAFGGSANSPEFEAYAWYCENDSP